MQDHERRNVPVTDRLHPAVWFALGGFVAWFVLAVWGFGSERYADWLLTVVSIFILIAVAIPLILALVWRNNRRTKRPPSQDIGEWASGDFQTWQDRVKGANAAAEIVLPIAAAAVGMTAFAIVFHYAHASA
jgi:hypothetical protein